MAPRSGRHAPLRLAVIATAVLGIVWGTGAAQERAADAHVRGLDAGARALIAEARGCSPTVGRLMAALDHSDVIVLVSLTFMGDGVAADTRFVTVTHRVRILSLRIHLMSAPWDSFEYPGA